MKEKSEKFCLVPALLESYAQAADKDRFLSSLSNAQIRPLPISKQAIKASRWRKIGTQLGRDEASFSHLSSEGGEERKEKKKAACRWWLSGEINTGNRWREGSSNAKAFLHVRACMCGVTEKGRVLHRGSQARKKRWKKSLSWSQATRRILHPWSQAQNSVQSTKQLKPASNGSSWGSCTQLNTS
jgi:hypothetical protein